MAGQIEGGPDWQQTTPTPIKRCCASFVQISSLGKFSQGLGDIVQGYQDVIQSDKAEITQTDL